MTHPSTEVYKKGDDNVINTFLSHLSEELLTRDLEKTVNAPKSKPGFCPLQEIIANPSFITQLNQDDLLQSSRAIKCY